MGVIIDTNVFVHWERGGHAIDFSRWQDHGDAAISVITVSELLVGVHRADTELRRKKRLAFVESVFAALPIYDFTMEVARVHAELLAILTARGEMIGAHDLIIAATAKYRGDGVLTTNVGDFRRVPGLKVVAVA
jgi:tRNA(fMet)-specific endonuclease VapC